MAGLLVIDGTAAPLFVSAVAETSFTVSEDGASGGRAEGLIGLIAQSCRAISRTTTDIDRIAVLTGPGSFTGIRSGIATAQGFAFGRSLPVLGISLFHAEALRALYGGNSEPAQVPGTARPANDAGLLYMPTVRGSATEWFSMVLTADAAHGAVSADARVAVLAGSEMELQSSAPPGAAVLWITRTPETAASRAAAIAAAFDRIAAEIGGREQAGPDTALRLSAGGNGILPLYVKAVNAKTLSERGQKSPEGQGAP